MFLAYRIILNKRILITFIHTKVDFSLTNLKLPNFSVLFRSIRLINDIRRIHIYLNIFFYNQHIPENKQLF